MKITIGILGSMNAEEMLDVTDYVSDETEAVLTQEMERDMFERAVDDVTIRLSNLDDSFTSFFLTQSPAAWWEVVITEDPLVWVGKIEPPVKFSVKSEMVEFTAFSLNRVFWDLCQASTLKGKYYPGFSDVKQNYVRGTVRGELEHYLEGKARPCRELKLNVEVDELYADRPVNKDQEFTLDDSMSIDRFLQGYAHYYNAQFYLDAETRTLKMLQRCMPIYHDDTDLDEILLDDTEIEFMDTDMKKYDYAEMSINIPVPPQPTYEIYNTKTAKGFNDVYVSYAVSFVISDGKYEYESGISAESNQKLIQDNGEGQKGSKVTVPQGPGGTTRRKIYREFGASFGRQGIFRCVGSIDNNSDIYFYDEMSNTELATQEAADMYSIPTGLMWYRYDEDLGTWIDPVIEYKGREGKPDGSIYQIKIDWKFVKTADKTPAAGNELALAMRYFGNEIDFFTFSKQWLELFITRRRIRAQVMGTGYRYGQTFVTEAMPYDGKVSARAFAVKLRNLINRERTELEIVTI